MMNSVAGYGKQINGSVVQATYVISGILYASLITACGLRKNPHCVESKLMCSTLLGYHCTVNISFSDKHTRTFLLS